MILSDLRQLKAELDINPNDFSEDLKLNFLITGASKWIEELLGRGDLAYQLYTEYYSSTLTGAIVLNKRPVYSTPAPQVFVDAGGYFGSVSGSFGSNTQQIYGQNFYLVIDEPDGISSRCGILAPINQGNGATQNGAWWNSQRNYQWGLLSPFLSAVPGSIKVVYYAGWTVDNLPADIRMACNFLVAKLRYVLPLGVELNSESYEERSIAAMNSQKDRLIALVKPMLWSHRNWSW